jgi:hypothetical protein
MDDHAKRLKRARRLVKIQELKHTIEQIRLDIIKNEQRHIEARQLQCLTRLGSHGSDLFAGSSQLLGSLQSLARREQAVLAALGIQQPVVRRSRLAVGVATRASEDALKRLNEHETDAQTEGTVEHLVRQASLPKG